MRISDWSSDVCSSDLRQDRMAPRGHLSAILLHGDQIDHAGDAGDPAADRTHAGKPEASAPPEFVKRPQVGEIRRHQADQRRDGEVNHHRVQRMAGNGGVTVDRLAFCGHPALPGTEVKRVARWSRRGGNPFKWTTLALAVPLLAACDGPQSALSPAGPLAPDVPNVGWATFGFSAVVLLVQSGDRRGGEEW